MKLIFSAGGNASASCAEILRKVRVVTDLPGNKSAECLVIGQIAQ
ncbi:MAG: hypothetical protein AAFN70_00380 [Planctomycetota bacterium]